MKIWMFAAALLMAAPVGAQPLQGHPQKAFYASPAEWPWDSAQLHWLQPGPSVVMPDHPTIPSNLSHTHMDLHFPRYADLSVFGPIRVDFAVKSFHMRGRVSMVEAQIFDANGGRHHPTDWVWDETGSAIPPDLTGDPMGLKVWTGHFTMDLTGISINGWSALMAHAETTFDNGANAITELFEPFVAFTDPTAPLGTEFDVRATTAVASPISHAAYGASVVQVLGSYLPVAPIFAPWTLTQILHPEVSSLLVFGYTDVGIPDASFAQIADLNLHEGIPGRTLSAKVLNDGSVWVPATFDPAILGSGPHKIAFTRSVAIEGEAAVTLLVLDIPVGDGIAPDPLTDLCPNVAGLQSGIPIGMVLDHGNCVVPSTAPVVVTPPTPPAPVFTTFTFVCDDKTPPNCTFSKVIK